MVNRSFKKRKSAEQKAAKKEEGKTEEKVEEKEKVKTTVEKVTLRNLCPHPVFFRTPAGTVRIGPRGTCDVEESLLATAELSRLCRNRQVSVVKKPKEVAKTEVEKGKEKGEQSKSVMETRTQKSDTK